MSVAQVGAVAVTPDNIRVALMEQPAGKVMKREELAVQCGVAVAGKRVMFNERLLRFAARGTCLAAQRILAAR